MLTQTLPREEAITRKNIFCGLSKTEKAKSLLRAQSRGVLILPGLGNNKADYQDMSQQLKQLGLTVEVPKCTGTH
jgi:esterase/lipase